MPNCLIVFDMDGVIVDVSQSYREAVRRTARLFFKGGHAFENLPDPLFPLSDLAFIKQSGGLNNDWDLTFRVINLLFSLVEAPSLANKNEPVDAHRNFVDHCGLDTLARFLKQNSQNPLATLLEQHGHADDDRLAVFYQGDVGSGNIIKQIFQEIYLGHMLFGQTYGIKPHFFTGAGLIERESLFISAEVIEQLAAKNTLAIATGRPKVEADYPLKQFGIGKYFDTVLTLDDCLKAEKKLAHYEGRPVSLSKPHPYMLDTIAAQISPPGALLFFIGDMPDDMQAAARSKSAFKGIGVVFSAPDKKSLSFRLADAGAYRVVDNVKRLLEVLESPQ